MPKGRVAQRSFRLSPRHTQTRVYLFVQIFRCNRLPEPRPARSRLKLCIRIEKRTVATDAAENSRSMLVCQFADSGGSVHAFPVTRDESKINPFLHPSPVLGTLFGLPQPIPPPSFPHSANLNRP